MSARTLQRLKRALKNSDVSREEIEDLRRKLLEAVPEQVMSCRAAPPPIRCWCCLKAFLPCAVGSQGKGAKVEVTCSSYTTQRIPLAGRE